MKEKLTIHYKEPEGHKGRFVSTEVVHLTSAHSTVSALFHSVARLFFTLTSCASESIIQVPLGNDLTTVKRSDKEAILGTVNLSKIELDLMPSDDVTLLHHDKCEKILREVMHQCDASRIVTCTVGGRPLITAMLANEISGLLLCKTDAHLKLVKDHALSLIRILSTNPNSRFYLAREDIIERLGLEPDRAESTDEAEMVEADCQPPVTGTLVESETPPAGVAGSQTGQSGQAATNTAATEPMETLNLNESDALTPWISQEGGLPLDDGHLLGDSMGDNLSNLFGDAGATAAGLDEPTATEIADDSKEDSATPGGGTAPIRKRKRRTKSEVDQARASGELPPKKPRKPAGAA